VRGSHALVGFLFSETDGKMAKEVPPTLKLCRFFKPWYDLNSFINLRRPRMLVVVVIACPIARRLNTKSGQKCGEGMRIEKSKRISVLVAGKIS
jgi:hypothetical protein